MSNLTAVDISYQKLLTQKLQLIAQNIALTDKTAAKGRTFTFKEHLNQKEGVEGLSFPAVESIRKDFSQGPLQVTSNPSDVALNGPGFFCTVAEDGTMLYTRNGNFHRNGLGQLVTIEGYPLFDEGNAPINIPVTTKVLTINSQGDLMGDGALIGRIKVVTFSEEDQQQLKEIGESYYITDVVPQIATQTKVIQGALEKSNISPILSITELTEVRHSWNQIHQFFQDEDDRRKRSIDGLGKAVE
jgi:flagellar basal-body rod protein FlgF